MLARAPKQTVKAQEVRVNDDLSYLRRALELAERGRHTVSPNPLVGCVIVNNGVIVGEGYHERPGGPHAEVFALEAAGERARGATVYVTLEPCNHTGRTPPCTDALIAAGVAAVVASVEDPNVVAAGGAARLREAGIEVRLGGLADEARRQNAVFFHGLAAGRPFVVAKAAVSLDGRIAAADGSSRWLTGQSARAQVHRLRANVDAVLVGSGTVLADDPELTCRQPGFAAQQPLRVVLDRRGRVGPYAKVRNHSAPTLISRHETLAALLDELLERGVRSVLVEGGGSVLHAFLSEDLVDRLNVHVAPVLLGDGGRPLLVGPWATTLDEAPRFSLDRVEQHGDDALLTLSPRRAGVSPTSSSTYLLEA